MTAFRVLVADKVKAQLYELPSRRSSLKALQSFVNPAGMQPERALGTSRPGRVTSGTGGGRHAFQPKHGIKEHAEEVFVRLVIAALETDAAANGGAPIVLVAAPRLLGTYRRHLPASLKDRVAVEVKLDLTKLPVLELNKRVREAVAALPMSVTSRFPTPRRRTKA
ncbi:MAG: host attachment protein [Chromatiales bacterium]|nr:host attachment protein [Chromatiales bacterium]